MDSNEVYLLINEIILDEWNRNRGNTLKDIESSIKVSSKNALKIKEFLSKSDRLKLEEVLENYNSKEQARFRLAEERLKEVEKLMAKATIVTITDEMKVKVANWALEKRAPFQQKNNSVADALILLSAVEHRKGYREKGFIPPGFFISFNHSDYSNGKEIDEIHEDLRHLLEQGNMEYKRHIGEALNLTPELNMEIEGYIDMMVENYIEQEREIRRGK